MSALTHKKMGPRFEALKEDVLVAPLYSESLFKCANCKGIYMIQFCFQSSGILTICEVWQLPLCDNDDLDILFPEH